MAPRSKAKMKSGTHKMPNGKTMKNSEMQDKKLHTKLTKNMNPTQKAAFMKANKKMDAKKPSLKADMKMDKTLAKKIMYKKAGRGK